MVRSDALENRARILVVAREMLADDDAASMNQIGRRAGVGAGTLYRHFPTRESLVLAVYRDEVDRIVASAPDLLESHPPIDALRLWTLDLVASMRRKHGLGDALSPGAHRAVAEETYDPVHDAIATLLDAGRAGGDIRPDADPADYLQFTAALWRASTTPVDRAPRMLDLLLDGLRTQR
jgi:AcrR family transcriptional regulator